MDPQNKTEAVARTGWQSDAEQACLDPPWIHLLQPWVHFDSYTVCQPPPCGPGQVWRHAPLPSFPELFPMPACIWAPRPRPWGLPRGPFSTWTMGQCRCQCADTSSSIAFKKHTQDWMISGGYMSLNICHNLQGLQHQKETQGAWVMTCQCTFNDRTTAHSVGWSWRGRLCTVWRTSSVRALCTCHSVSLWTALKIVC